uniref:Uncharacterized protein n=1 Tax=Cucumis melo TaxID=3656 RepID=A0A9I9CYS1_CUCME
IQLLVGTIGHFRFYCHSEEVELHHLHFGEAEVELHHHHHLGEVEMKRIIVIVLKRQRGRGGAAPSSSSLRGGGEVAPHHFGEVKVEMHRCYHARSYNIVILESWRSRCTIVILERWRRVAPSPYSRSCTILKMNDPLGATYWR